MEVRRGALRRKLTLQVFLPFCIGAIICVLCALLPMYFQCTDTVDWVVEKLTHDQNAILKQISFQVAVESSALLQIPTNFMLIAADMITRYNSLSLKIKADYLSTEYTMNGKLFTTGEVTCEQYDTKFNASFVNSSWYLGPNITTFPQISKSSRMNLARSSIFDSFMRPIAAVAKTVNNSLQQVYVAYESDGMFYMNPARKMQALVNCTDCPQQDYYDPRTRPYFTEALKEQNTNKAVLVPIYKFASQNYLGQTVCTSSNYTDMNFTTTCLDYDNMLLREHLSSITMGGTTYSYAVSTQGTVYTHPDLPINSTTLNSITYYEMDNKNASSAEKRYFNKTILPLFEDTRHTVHAKYHINGELINIAISPIFVKLKLGDPISESLTHVYSVGVAMKQKVLESDIKDLKSDSTKIYLYEVILFLCFAALILLLWLFLNNHIANSIVRPIDELNDFLDKLINRDFNAKIDGTTGDHSYDMNLLKKSMSRLQIMLKVTEPSYVDSQHGLSYVAKALELFEDMGNKVAAAKCYKQIGLLDLRDGRYGDALRCFRKAYKAYREFNSGLQTIELARLMIECLMHVGKAGAEYDELIGYLEIVKVHSSNIGNIVQTAKAELEIARVLVKQGQIEEAEVRVAKSRNLVPRLSVESLQDSLEEHALFVEGMISQSKGQLHRASELLNYCITTNPHYDPAIRLLAAKLLNEILEGQGLKCRELKALANEGSSVQDIVVVMDCSERSGRAFNETVTYFRNFLKKVCKPGDRLGLVSANSNVILSKSLSRIKSVRQEKEFSQLEWARPKGEADISKAIRLAMKLLDSGLSIDPEFNYLMDLVDTAQPKRKQWLIVLARSAERGISEKVRECLRTSDCHLVVIGLDLRESDEASLIVLANSASHGRFVHARHIGLLEEALDWIGVSLNSERACASLL
mmetsp:Transcript_9549/g.18603  ORF Transcript_9549/g.18603 Transcript_9549/m.18603 type:complete len:922 (-) Transcript_9549:1479-4244(-)